MQTVFAQLVAGKQQRTFVVVLSSVVQVPVELEKLFVILEHALPDREQLERIARELTSASPEDLPSGDDLQRVLDSAAGLTRYEAEGAFALSLTRHNTLRFDYGADCRGSCAVCGELRCHECLHHCALCGVWCCAGCKARSTHSDRLCCKGCVGTCSACGAVTARDELDDETLRCPSCHPAVADPGTISAPEVAALFDSEPSLTETDHDPATPVPAGA
jgi:hypothetical protein